ncbi:MAG TPA: 6-carboxytetrahydropterin synthase [Polyangia bacterium]|jgi:6-pyruvoyltetrahydropterin/6-carboxytetrahydropterin synthase|nr:6-carboxytetrahydropterin synthase [Polyangia bacterium]
MSRYTVGVIRDFIASHFLFGGDWGRENQLHAHHYRLEASFAGDALDRHGYLLDIAVVKDHLDALVARFRDRLLNDAPELAGQNPGLEPFARVLAEELARTLVPALAAGTLASLTVKLWEDDEAFATYTRAFA